MRHPDELLGVVDFRGLRRSELVGDDVLSEVSSHGTKKLLVVDADGSWLHREQSCRTQAVVRVSVPVEEDVDAEVVHVLGEGTHVLALHLMEELHVVLDLLAPVDAVHGLLEELSVVRGTRREHVYLELGAVVEAEDVLREVDDCLGPHRGRHIADLQHSEGESECC